MKRKLLGSAFATMLCIHGISQAATGTANFQSSAQITASCQIQSSALNFGTIDPNVYDQRAQADINVKCSKSLSYNIIMSGMDANGVRKMSGESGNTDTLQYTVYTAGDYENPIDDGQNRGFNTRTIEGIGTGDNVVHTVYGQVDNMQYVKPGIYSDTLTMTITY